MTPQRNKRNRSVCTLLLLNTISIITYEAAQLYQKTKTLKGSKVIAINHSNKRIDQMHENQENSNNMLQYITQHL